MPDADACRPALRPHGRAIPKAFHGSWLATTEAGHIGAFDAIDHETRASFLAPPIARASPDHKRGRRTSLRTIFRYAHEAGHSQSNPARLIRRALCGSPQPRAASDEEAGPAPARALEGGRAGGAAGSAAVHDNSGSGIRLVSKLALDADEADLECGEPQPRRKKTTCRPPCRWRLPCAITCAVTLRGYIEGRGAGPLCPGLNEGAMCARHVRLAIWCKRRNRAACEAEQLPARWSLEQLRERNHEDALPPTDCLPHAKNSAGPTDERHPIGWVGVRSPSRRTRRRCGSN